MCSNVTVDLYSFRDIHAAVPFERKHILQTTAGKMFTNSCKSKQFSQINEGLLWCWYYSLLVRHTTNTRIIVLPLLYTFFPIYHVWSQSTLHCHSFSSSSFSSLLYSIFWTRSDFLFCFVQKRYQNRPIVEFEIAAQEQMKITELRLGKLFLTKSIAASTGNQYPTVSATKVEGIFF